jgi:hypothetical protein
MAITQANLDVLDAAISAGVLTVEYDGKRITYQRIDMLIKARDLIATQLARQANGGRAGASVGFINQN